jgi:hypothetical protein
MKDYIKVVYSKYYAEFYHRSGGGWSRQPFYVCGNAGIGEEFAEALNLLGHHVTAETREEEEDV